MLKKLHITEFIENAKEEDITLPLPEKRGIDLYLYFAVIFINFILIFRLKNNKIVI